MASPFNSDELFDDEYLRIMRAKFAERTDEDVRAIRQLSGLRSGMRVLDAPCGHGRIANQLAQLGCEVVGVDRSEHFIALAAEEAARDGVRTPPTYRVGELLHLPVSGLFDVAVSWFSSFGYEASDMDNRLVLESYRRALRPKGRLVLEQLNPLWLLGELGTSGETTFTDRYEEGLLVQDVRWEATTGRSMVKRTIASDGQLRELSYSIRLLTPTEMSDWLLHAGFRSVELTQPDGSPLTTTSKRMAAVAVA